MKKTLKRVQYSVILSYISRFVGYFLLIGFVITCCILLFLHTMESTGIVYTRENIEFAAKITFANIFILSLLFLLLDTVHRYLSIRKPLKEIENTINKAINGDFSVRIDENKFITSYNTGFPIVVRYINQMLEELSGTETLRMDFIANVSHELKSPLAVMQNYGTLLQQPGLSEENRIEYAKAITDASRRLANMVTNILKLNKLENQTIYADIKTYDLSEQLCECFLSFEELWEKKELKIDTDIEENILVKTDPELLMLVWNNLISNAIKFTGNGGTVILRARKDGECAVVELADTGCGISAEVGKHIFEKFYQGDVSHSAKGNGLGLALVKRVMDIVGGNIGVSSEVGKGSTFTVRLRRQSDEEA